MNHVVIIGAGPAGLMAAETAANHGVRVTVCEAKPSVGRKFLMAGKSGLNLTKNEDTSTLLAAFAEATPDLRPMIEEFDANAVQVWAQGLGQEVFTGSTGRVFPKAMKASPLLRAWLSRLADMGVSFNTRRRWAGWQDGALSFETPSGLALIEADATVLALGGASWSRLGSDGLWQDKLLSEGVDIHPFAAANTGLAITWSTHMTAHLGQALKGISLTAGTHTSRGEAVLSRKGLEGGGVYSVSRGVREGADLSIDLLPDQPLAAVIAGLSKPRGKTSLSNVLRKALKLDAAKVALLNEMARPLPTAPTDLARLIKALPILHDGLRPMDEAISTAGGIAWSALDPTLMLHQKPGVFAAGEMLDWEAPTGGYLITGCLATGRWAGQNAAAFAKAQVARA